MRHPEKDVEFPVDGSGHVPRVFHAHDVKYLAAPGSPGPDHSGVLNRHVRHVWVTTAWVTIPTAIVGMG